MAVFSVVGLIIQLVALIGMGIVAFLAWNKAKCTTDKDGKTKCGCNNKGINLNKSLGIACIVTFVIMLLVLIGIIVVDLRSGNQPSGQSEYGYPEYNMFSGIYPGMPV